MSGYQIAMIALLGLSLIHSLIHDGEYRTGKYSFSNTVISVAIWVFILFGGGFFK